MKNLTTILGVLITPIILYYSCTQEHGDRYLEAPLLQGLGDYHWEVTVPSKSALVQKLFDQGMVMAYGFNHAEAARTFREAIKIDTACAMCYWGLSYVLGPNINASMDPLVVVEARLAAEKAAALAPRVSEMEALLIDAMLARYPQQAVEDRSQLDEEYASRMRLAYTKYPNHADVATLTAEALMDLHPWDYWERDGNPKPWTMEIINILEKQMQRFPSHPGGNHLYIHAVEASSRPDRGLEAAKRLETLVPNSGHLVHMPSHIYLRTGKYHDGVRVNKLAVISDSAYVAACRTTGMYPLLLYPHNYHFLAACAALEGNAADAINAAVKVSANVAGSLRNDPMHTTLQHYSMIPLYSMVKFAQWDHILEWSRPGREAKYPQVVWHYSRGMAWLGKGSLEKADEHFNELLQLSQDSSLAEQRIWEVNSALDLALIARNILEGELALARQSYGPAIEAFTRAVAIEDRLTYQEPPDWFFSTRHHLAQALLTAGDYAGAEEVLRQDLVNLPENGWALSGLFLSLEKQGKADEAAHVRQRFQRAWKHADVQLEGVRVATAPQISIRTENKTLNLSSFAGLAACTTR